MDFFKSVFSEDPSPTLSLSPTSSTSDNHNPGDSPTSPSDPHSQNPDAKPKSPSTAISWTTFGSSLLKTVATKSEPVIGNYCRDLEEFSFGLRKETAIIRQAANRAVRDLPSRLESGASVARSAVKS